jgi:hypothetical protein
MMYRAYIIILLLCCSGRSYAIETAAGGRMGGYLGFISLGLGLSNDDRTYRGEALLGYVPTFLGGEELWSLAVRGDIVFASLYDNKLKLYGGTGLIGSFDKDTFILLPKQYPAGYYPSTGIFVAPYIGSEWSIGDNSAVSFEVTTLDFYLELYVRNPDYLAFRDIVTYGVGYKFYLP